MAEAGAHVMDAYTLAFWLAVATAVIAALAAVWLAWRDLREPPRVESGPPLLGTWK